MGSRVIELAIAFPNLAWLACCAAACRRERRLPSPSEINAFLRFSKLDAILKKR